MTAPGWSILAIFYATGKPSNGCNQLNSGRDGVKRFQCFLSRNWSPPANNHARVIQVGKDLKTAGLVPWLDQDRLDMRKHDHIHAQLKLGIDLSAVVVVFITAAYIHACESGDELDNCYREYVHCRTRVWEEAVVLLPVVAEAAVRDPATWGCLKELFRVASIDWTCKLTGVDARGVRGQRGAIAKKIAALLHVNVSRFFITGRNAPDWRSHVRELQPYTAEGFSADFSSCGAGGVFDAYTARQSGLCR